MQTAMGRCTCLQGAVLMLAMPAGLYGSSQSTASAGTSPAGLYGNYSSATLMPSSPQPAVMSSPPPNLYGSGIDILGPMPTAPPPPPPAAPFLMSSPDSQPVAGYGAQRQGSSALPQGSSSTMAYGHYGSYRSGSYAAGNPAAGPYSSSSVSSMPIVTAGSYATQLSGSYGQQTQASYAAQPQGSYSVQPSGSTGQTSAAQGTYGSQLPGSYGQQTQASYAAQPQGSYSVQPTGSADQASAAQGADGSQMPVATSSTTASSSSPIQSTGMPPAAVLGPRSPAMMHLPTASRQGLPAVQF